MISDEKKLELIRAAWSKGVASDCHEDEIDLTLDFAEGDENKIKWANGFLDALRQLEPVIEFVKVVEGELNEYNDDALKALKAAGLEE